jgi:pyridoxine/pyridoxamine 5'-phosphate oxidase
MPQNWRSEDLAELEADCWKLLEQGSKDRKQNLHTIVLATVHQGEPRLRTVVLRRVDIAEKHIYAHVDLRSPKAADILSNPLTSWLAYDPVSRVQIRLSGKSEIHNHDELCRKHWEATGHHSRRFYMRPQEGQPLDGPQQLDQKLREFHYGDEDTEMAYKDFAVIQCDVTFMDFYALHHEGNRRAEFRYTDGGLTNMNWISA